MPLFDMPLDELENYRPARHEPGDFDAFWQDTLSDARTHPIEARFEPIDFRLHNVETYDLTFAGFAGQPIKGWLLLPKQRGERIPCVVEYIGYGGGRCFPTDWLLWATVGYAHMVMDTRGQGSVWGPGDTPDTGSGAGPHVPGFMTDGIGAPQTYYYRRLFTDAVRAIDAAALHPRIDSSRIAVSGQSQGGGIALAVAGLEPRVVVSMPDVPFLCNYKRATEITDASPYGEIARYCRTHRDKVDTVFETLAYFDGMNFASRASARSLFSAGLMDEICPPSTVYAAYNYYAGPKEMRVWRYNNHEGGASYQTQEKVRYLTSLWPVE